MSQTTDSNGVAVFDNHQALAEAIHVLERGGFNMKKVSVVGRDDQNDANAVGFYAAGGRVKHWGKLGGFWGAVFGILMAPAFFWIPGIGPILTGGLISSLIMGAVEGGVVGAALGSGSGALAAALVNLGIPQDRIARYGDDIKANRFLLITSGTQEEIVNARSLLLHRGERPKAAAVVAIPTPKDPVGHDVRAVATTYDEIARETTPTFDMFHSPPSPTSVSSTELAASVRAAIQTDRRLAEANIDVVAHASRIWLSGEVIGPGTAAYAGDVAKKIDGVIDVHNDLAVTRGSSPAAV